jgi:hypothetical protein
MIRTRIAALLFALAFLGTIATASAAGPEQLKVNNMTQTKAWITLYADVGAFGWAQHHFATPAYTTYGSPWVYTRGSKDPNGPWKVRAEVTNSAGKKYDIFTTMWYDGSQHRFNAPGDPSTYLFVCEKNNEFYWSFQSNCAGNENTKGI